MEFEVHPAEAYLAVRWGTLSPKPPGIYRFRAKPGAMEMAMTRRTKKRGGHYDGFRLRDWH
jgi:hypothetical protein